MKKYGESLLDAVEEVKSKRPEIDPNNSFLNQIQVWQKVGYQIWEDEEKKVPKAAYQEVLDDINQWKKEKEEKEKQRILLVASVKPDLQNRPK